MIKIGIKQRLVIVKEVDFTLTDENDHRCNIYIHKQKDTPIKYPRQFGKIKKKPL
jgi:16S rRNA (guanine527-N7)-methyltransferase